MNTTSQENRWKGIVVGNELEKTSPEGERELVSRNLGGKIVYMGKLGEEKYEGERSWLEDGL